MLDSRVADSVLSRIGNSPLLELQRIVPPGCARVLIKVESENPSGSMKDRMALAMIEAAEADGRLAAGGSVVEYTGGSTGVSLALVCSVKGYPLDIVTSDAFSVEKRRQMAAYGARLHVIESNDGGMDAALTRAMIARADAIRQENGAFWTDQLNNADQLACYRAMADEIWQQTGGEIDAWVQCVGTGASLRGVAEALRLRRPELQVIAVEPAESAVLSGRPSGTHRIEGVGAGFVVPLWKADVASGIARVSTDDSMAMARRLAQTEGLFAGTSTGMNLVAALELARTLGPGSSVVTVMPDTGIKYLSTELYRDIAGPD